MLTYLSFPEATPVFTETQDGLVEESTSMGHIHLMVCQGDTSHVLNWPIVKPWAEVAPLPFIATGIHLRGWNGVPISEWEKTPFADTIQRVS